MSQHYTECVILFLIQENATWDTALQEERKLVVNMSLFILEMLIIWLPQLHNFWKTQKSERSPQNMTDYPAGGSLGPCESLYWFFKSIYNLQGIK